MKLDNRPRKLLVKGVPEDSVEIAQNWYGVRVFSFPAPSFVIENESFQTTNGVESVERLADGDLIVAFKTRSSAEQVRLVLRNYPPLPSYWRPHLSEIGVCQGIKFTHRGPD